MKALYKRQDGPTLICIPSTGAAGAPFLQITLLPNHMEFANLSEEPVGWQSGEMIEQLAAPCLAWGRCPGRQEAEQMLAQLVAAKAILGQLEQARRLAKASASIDERFLRLTEKLEQRGTPLAQVAAAQHRAFGEETRKAAEELLAIISPGKRQASWSPRDLWNRALGWPLLHKAVLSFRAWRVSGWLNRFRSDMRETHLCHALRDWVVRQA
jgi:hypothetical protein